MNIETVNRLQLSNHAVDADSMDHRRDYSIILWLLWQFIRKSKLIYRISFQSVIVLVLTLCSCEQVPELSTFLLISIFPQFPLVIYLGYFQSLKYPIDNILGTFMMLFLVSNTTRTSILYSRLIIDSFLLTGI